ncbi:MULTISPECIES: response regulator transcription factor [Brevibacterium]|uniref:response regulator transcription factor n=1 Tax=Brevibacterium TaxID=1696 RepID=UPI001BA4767F|nr:response regulator transcription factor [Brevibacterium sp. W7.2]
MRIAIVDDEPRIVEAVSAAVALAGHETLSAGSGEDALVLMAEHDVDALVLDVSMPGLSGLAVARALRAAGDRLPILMLTARTSVRDRVDGLDAGADDYLTKPFDMEELLARLRALLRRVDDPAAAQLRFGDLEFDPGERTGQRGGRRIDFTATEAAILRLLITAPDRVFTRAQIAEEVWDRTFDPGSNSLTVYIGYLRRKLNADGDEPLIQTVQGLGYRLGVRA